MSKPGGTQPKGKAGAETEGVLRAKYLDYCSAQVADILLLLSPDEMYVLSRDAAKESGVSGGLSYEEIVRLATDRMARKLSLPPFPVWAEDYRRNPERYERYLMGLWESEIAAPRDG